MSTMGNC